jgi:hypothetical protein
MADRFSAWVDAYEAAWRTAGTDSLRGLFTEDATYRPSPFDDPLVGVEAIARFWEDERDGPDEVFTIDTELVAAQDASAVVRAEVAYAGPPLRLYRDLWVITLDRDGRCTAFEEWPFHPGQARTAP